MFKKLSKKYTDLQNGKIQKESFEQGLQSYLGIVSHCDGQKIKVELHKQYNVGDMFILDSETSLE